jgi:hypothetical protein
MPWAVIVVWSLYVAVVGGDIFPGFRQLVPVLVALCFLVADEAGADWARIASQRLLILPIFALCVFLHTTQATETAENRRAQAELWEWEGLSMGRTLKAAFGAKRPLLAVDSAGALPFWSELPSLDMLGLNDRHIAETRPRDFGKRYVGHELGDGAYVLGRAPDLVVFQNAVGTAKPEYRSGVELTASKEFQRTYQLIRVLGTFESRVVGEIWVRRERGKLGVVRATDRIEVPGYFFTGQASLARSSLDKSGVLVAELSAKKPGVVPELSIPAGRWRLEISPSHPALAVDVRCRDASMQSGALAAERVFDADGVSPISIAVAPELGGRPVKLRSVTLVRAGAALSVLRCVRAGAPLRVPAASLAAEKTNKVSWAHPSNVAFGKSGVVVELGSRDPIERLDVSLSQNDAYQLELRRDGHVAWLTNIEKKRKPKGTVLAVHRFQLPKPVEAGNFELQITPRRGDVPNSVGHVATR